MVNLEPFLDILTDFNLQAPVATLPPRLSIHSRSSALRVISLMLFSSTFFSSSFVQSIAVIQAWRERRTPLPKERVTFGFQKTP